MVIIGGFRPLLLLKIKFMGRSTCFICGKVRNSEYLHKVILPRYVSSIINPIGFVFICKASSCSHISRWESTLWGSPCVISFQSQIKLLQENVVPELTILLKKVDNLLPKKNLEKP